MTKEEIIKLYIADLNNLVADSDAKSNRIIDLYDELEAIKQGQSLPIDSVSQHRELLIKELKDVDLKYIEDHEDQEWLVDRLIELINCG